MKICFIGQKGIPAKAGGVERHVEELSTRLVKAGHDVTVYTRPSYVEKRLKEYKGVRLVSLPSIHTKNLDAISHTFFACLHIIFRGNYDIVVFEAIGPSSLIWLIRLFRPDMPVVGALRCKCYNHGKWGGFARAYLRFGEYACAKFSDMCLASSRKLQVYALEKYGVKSGYITNGVAEIVKVEPDNIKTIWGLKKNGYFLAVSRLIPHKGIHFLIEAYKLLNTDKKLVIVGDGSFTDEYVWILKEMAGDNKNIIFTGDQYEETLSELYSNAFAFVQPSEAEGLSNALLEAMSHGLPVLSSDIPENLEAIGETGFTFRSGNVADLVKGLKYLLNNKEEVKLKGRLSQARVREFYNWDNIVSEAIKVYSEVIEEKKSKGIIRTIPAAINRLTSYLF